MCPQAISPVGLVVEVAENAKEEEIEEFEVIEIEWTAEDCGVATELVSTPVVVSEETKEEKEEEVNTTEEEEEEDEEEEDSDSDDDSSVPPLMRPAFGGYLNDDDSSSDSDDSDDDSEGPPPLIMRRFPRFLDSDSDSDSDDDDDDFLDMVGRAHAQRPPWYRAPWNDEPMVRRLNFDIAGLFHMILRQFPRHPRGGDDGDQEPPEPRRKRYWDDPNSCLPDRTDWVVEPHESTTTTCPANFKILLQGH